MPAYEQAYDVVRPGGTISRVGVHDRQVWDSRSELRVVCVHAHSFVRVGG